MYSKRISFLEESLKVIDARIKTATDTSALLDEKAKYQKELSQMYKLQWEHIHESVDLDEDR